MLSPSEWTHEEVLDKLTSLPINSILCFQKSTAGRPLRKEARARAAKSPWPFYAELKGSIGEGPNHSNHSNHSNSFKIGLFL